MKKLLMLFFCTLIVGTTLHSCREMGLDPRDKDPGGGNPIDTSGNLPFEKLVGTKWQLTSIEDNPLSGQQKIQPVGKEQVISLIFETPTQVSGTNICNNYTATVMGTAKGLISFSNIISTQAACINEFLNGEYMATLYGAQSYTATDKELRIRHRFVSAPNTENGDYQITCNTLVFAPLSSNGGNNGDVDIRIKQLAGQTYSLYSIVNGGFENVFTDSKNCMITLNPGSGPNGKGTASLLADCNKGAADLSFNTDFTEMKLDNIGLTKVACQNQQTATQFVDFLRNTGRFEYSDYGTTLTIWTSLTTFAESKMVLKVAQVDPPPQGIIEIQDTPATGVPQGSYPSFTLKNVKFDGTYLNISYEYNGKTNDYSLSAYSKFDFSNTATPVVVVDIVADGSPNPVSSITQGEAILSIAAISKHTTTTNPGSKTVLDVMLRFNGTNLGKTQITL